MDAGYRDIDQNAAVAANASWWTREADAYYAEHGRFLGDAELRWCPEGLTEERAHLLGPVAGRELLEIGAGAAQGSRWAIGNGARAIALDLSEGMLRVSREIDERMGTETPTVLGDALSLPFAADSFDTVFTAYGVLPFVRDIGRVHAQVFRVLRPGGRWVFSTTHPIRWAFPDSPGFAGLTVEKAYFDPAPYVESGDGGETDYAEFHHTLAEHVNSLTSAGFTIERMVEPEWMAGDQVWGGWSRLRGEKIPGTLILASRKPE